MAQYNQMSSIISCFSVGLFLFSTIELPELGAIDLSLRTEAERYYDLGVSYIKSGLYEDGLKTLNQVAFLYPESKVADDALYELALLRERAGDGEVSLGEKKRLQTQQVVVDRLIDRYNPQTVGGAVLAGVLAGIQGSIAGQRAFEPAKEYAVTEYLLGLDYLNMLVERYPESDFIERCERTSQRLIEKMERLIPTKMEQDKRQKAPVRFEKRRLIIFGCFSAVLLTAALLVSLSQ